MTKAIVIILAYGVGAAAFTIGFDYLGDQHQGLLVFAAMTMAISAGRKASKNTAKEEH